MELTDRCPLCDELKLKTLVVCNYCARKHIKDLRNPNCDVFAKKRYRSKWGQFIHWLGRKVYERSRI